MNNSEKDIYGTINNIYREGGFIVRDNKVAAVLLPLVIGPASIYFAIYLFILIALEVPFRFSFELNKLHIILLFIGPPVLGGFFGGLFTPSKRSSIQLGFRGTLFGATVAIITAIIVIYLAKPEYFYPSDLVIFVLVFIYGLIVLISAITTIGSYLGAMMNLRM